MACLLSYAWPGNVRELENVVERALVLAEGKLVGVRDLPERVRSGAAAGPTTDAAVGPAASAESGTDLSLKRAMRHLEERFIRAALERTRGNRTRAAELLEISPRALLYKLKEYGIH
jgi:two-component system response regulator AtoC